MAAATGASPELVDLISRWVGADVTIRVLATESDELIGIFAGRLQSRSDEKHPALFWPLEPGSSSPEQTGIYLHPDSYTRHRIREGGFVLEFEQAGVTTNLRRLDDKAQSGE